MTQMEFLEEIREAYLKARKFKYTPKGDAQVLSRGTSHSISSLSEDLFACYCAERVTNSEGIRIFIDPPISFKGTLLKNKSKKKSLLIRPDIALFRASEINCLLDIKTDLGYKRKIFLDQARERNLQMDLIKNQVASLNDGETKIPENIRISKNIKFVYVIISEGNIKKSISEEIADGIKKLENIDMFVLSIGEHLNTYQTISKWQINNVDFDALDNLLENYLN